jgi:hypothetical protein
LQDSFVDNALYLKLSIVATNGNVGSAAPNTTTVLLLLSLPETRKAVDEVSLVILLLKGQQTGWNDDSGFGRKPPDRHMCTL